VTSLINLVLKGHLEKCTNSKWKGNKPIFLVSTRQEYRLHTRKEPPSNPCIFVSAYIKFHIHACIMKALQNHYFFPFFFFFPPPLPCPPFCSAAEGFVSFTAADDSGTGVCVPLPCSAGASSSAASSATSGSAAICLPKRPRLAISLPTSAALFVLYFKQAPDSGS